MDSVSVESYVMLIVERYCESLLIAIKISYYPILGGGDLEKERYKEIDREKEREKYIYTYIYICRTRKLF